MSISYRRVAKGATFVLVFSALTACGLPRGGPNKNELFRAVADQTVNAFVVPVDERVTQIMPPAPDTFFPPAFISAPPLSTDVIRPGDTLNFTIYENVDDGLFSSGGSASRIGTIQVDNDGFIFIPYVGRIRAAGNTPERMRQIITDRLAEKTPQPQVLVQRTAGAGGNVVVVGNGIGRQGTFPIGQSSLRLISLLGEAGGVAGDPRLVNVIIIRGQHRYEMRYDDIYDDPRYDIALRPMDRIIVEREGRTFLSFGATGRQGRVPFEKQNMSALDAIARTGLRQGSADPTGIFVIREERPDIANAVLGRSDFTTKQRLIYLLDITEPSGLFFAKNFLLQDDDTVYVTEAPFTQWTRTVNAVIGTASSVRTLEATVTPSN